jgi:hypothetical protein
MWLSVLSSASILIPTFLGLNSFKYLFQGQKYFIFYILLSLVFEIVTDLFYFFDINNLWLFKLILVADLFFFIWYFYKLGIQTNLLKNILAVVAFDLVILVLNGLTKIGIRFDSLFFLSIFLFFIIQSALTMIYIFENIEGNPTSYFLFWISFARLIYFLIIFIIYIFPNIRPDIFNNMFFGKVFYIINATGNIICNILYGGSFLCIKINK